MTTHRNSTHTHTPDDVYNDAIKVKTIPLNYIVLLCTFSHSLSLYYTHTPPMYARIYFCWLLLKRDYFHKRSSRDFSLFFKETKID